MTAQNWTEQNRDEQNRDEQNRDEQRWYGTLGVFDLETTGIDVRTSRIVSANVSVIDAAGAVIERTDWLADPGIEIPPQASAVHGI
ncbi:MAG TPA: hypothetical protein VFS93_02700, partial [Terrimesophilobacter sp.]|nr:hypothetical protein [Terrimesophilobacter sp.]